MASQARTTLLVEAAFPRSTTAGQPLHSLLAAEFGVPFVAGYVASYMLVSMGIFNVILAVYVDITMKALPFETGGSRHNQIVMFEALPLFRFAGLVGCRICMHMSLVKDGMCPLPS